MSMSRTAAGTSSVAVTAAIFALTPIRADALCRGGLERVQAKHNTRVMSCERRAVMSTQFDALTGAFLPSGPAAQLTPSNSHD